jgi:xanthine dehydrogenase accessory factor
VKHWKETAEIFGRAARLVETGGRVAIATVVRVEGSAYRRPGAKLLVEEDGRTQGSISGGCREADVREIGLQVLRGSESQLRRYDTGGDDREVWGLGLGCSGMVEVFVQPIEQGAAGLVKRICELLAEDRPFALSTVVKGAGVALSIVAELLAVRSSREPSHLSRREAAIHAT